MKPGIRPGYHPLVVVEVSADSHPSWTGAHRYMDTAGGVQKFRRGDGQRGLRSEDGR
ncbi:50S ribosomal protein L31 [Mycolicibacterium komossense]|uniref:50S ribosomal protein L31 n=1 Tax=Mycolicibacterium komossense TaxID=1779 RepID=A0ABT3CM41_9MYCO|nr:50S ribosomal protein L31 [Mycolicibacterium komossense]MCV7230522.1 50S ribosomal protein L31 [Mycolicibacterium komossense]